MGGGFVSGLQSVSSNSPRAAFRSATLLSVTSSKRGGLLAIAFALVAGIGLGLWFYGTDGAEFDSVSDLERHLNSKSAAMAGATMIIAAMLVLFAFTRWLAEAYRARPLVVVGATVLALGGLTHLIENVLVLVLFSGDMTSQGLWDTINALSYTAFGVLGAGALIAAIGLPGPLWLRIAGVLTGLLGLGAAVSPWTGVFLPGPQALPIWLIALGFVRPRET